jgi:hypothetical protein
VPSARAMIFPGASFRISGKIVAVTSTQAAIRTSKPRRSTLILKITVKIAIAVAVWFALTRRPSVAVGSLLASARGEPVPRGEVILRARSYAEHSWQPGAANIRHGIDARGAVVETPDNPTRQDLPNRWRVGARNVGVPYKWGGFDTPERL